MANPYDAFIYNAAGTASAPSILDLKPGDSIVLSYRGENIITDALGQNFAYVSTVAATNALGNPSDLTVAFAHPNFVPTTVDYTDVGVITVSLDADATQGATYAIEIRAGNLLQGDIEAGSASRSIDSIPEFPTVALPIAAILGLVFIFGRRKEEL